MKEQKTKGQIICDAVCGLLMILAIISFLIVGFITKIWHPTWLILLCSALVCAIIGLISNTTHDLKTLEQNQKNDENKN